MVNRTQALVLGFFLVALVSLLVILVAAPKVYDQALRLPGAGGAAEIAFLAALTGFLTLLAVGVVRRWRWAFWLILVAFLAGVLRVPVAILQLTGACPQTSQPGMSHSRASSAWRSSPLAWPCWPAIDALASGGPSDGSGDRVMAAWWPRGTRQGPQSPTPSCQAGGGPAWPVPGLGVKIGARSGPRGATDRDQLVLADHEADPEIFADGEVADPAPIGQGAGCHDMAAPPAGFGPPWAPGRPGR